MNAGVRLVPGAVRLADWRSIYFGAPAVFDESCRSVLEAGARTVAAIVARGAPVYGINTGFGKLARYASATPTCMRFSKTSCSRTPQASANRCQRRSCGSRWR